MILTNGYPSQSSQYTRIGLGQLTTTSSNVGEDHYMLSHTNDKADKAAGAGGRPARVAGKHPSLEYTYARFTSFLCRKQGSNECHTLFIFL